MGRGRARSQGSLPGRHTANAPINRHSTECDSDDVCKLARELSRRTDDGSSLAPPTSVLRSALGRLGGPLS